MFLKPVGNPHQYQSGVLMAAYGCHIDITLVSASTGYIFTNLL